MQLVPGIEDSFSASGGELQIGGVPVSKLAEEFGTPLFAYDESVMRRKWELLRSTFPPRFEINYSVKANPEPAHPGIFSGARRRTGNRFGGRAVSGPGSGLPSRSHFVCGSGKGSRRALLSA